MKNAASAKVSKTDDGEVVEAFGTNIIRIRSADTGGALAVMEVVFPEGAGTPTHVHVREDEMFRVISGVFGFWCGDEYEELRTGGLIFLPRGLPHRVKNVGTSSGRVMVTLTPGGFEDFFARVSEGGNPETLAEEFGLQFV